MIFGLGLPAALSDLDHDHDHEASTTPRREAEVQWAQTDRFGRSWLGICGGFVAGPGQDDGAGRMTSPTSGRRPAIMVTAAMVTTQATADTAAATETTAAATVAGTAVAGTAVAGTAVAGTAVASAAGTAATDAGDQLYWQHLTGRRPPA